MLKCLPENEQTEAMREAGIQICVCNNELSQAVYHVFVQRCIQLDAHLVLINLMFSVLCRKLKRRRIKSTLHGLSYLYIIIAY